MRTMVPDTVVYSFFESGHKYYFDRVRKMRDALTERNIAGKKRL